MLQSSVILTGLLQGTASMQGASVVLTAGSPSGCSPVQAVLCQLPFWRCVSVSCGGTELGATAGASSVLTKSFFHLKRPVQVKETIFHTGVGCTVLWVLLRLHDHGAHADSSFCSGLGEARAVGDLRAAEPSPVLFNLEMQN